MKLDIESDKVLEAAKQCPQAEKVLKTLFPQVFGEKYSRGTRFAFTQFGECKNYILCKNRTRSIRLIDVGTGDVWQGASVISNNDELYISSEEFNFLVGDYKFYKI